ncbi:copper amine oxidase N-terminal domain-containing protein [Paenibacillus barcinonensis]|uniref:copper amine oxidase N-terminal domain-containing protein n=1 Tax=Paenibacillus barcinonensis TaxID=198119 RepID=UPI001C12012D|nr:copper amine oxidase N-terminal domain-containing protein [Paenibacillus barcinonensis]MBU5354742.1 copper amine oxidase N-terminal domain-containing protein [Paenibacillus barcinonensis]
MRKAGGNQVKKVMSALAVSAMLMSALPLSVMDAAARISIYINDAELPSAQAPVMKAGRVLVPLRSIFEGLDANVKYSNKTKRITATRGDQEVSLTLGSKVAYINGQLTMLDVPASTIKGNTMVPIRFVSEAFGEKVFWNSRNQRVDIKTTSSTPETPVDDTQFAAWNIYGSVSGSNGDGRDLTVSFTRATSEKTVSAYRIMLVKTRDVNSFNEKTASAVPSANYTSITPNGSNPKLTLNAQTRDVNGDLLNSNESYRLYVLTVGNSGNNYKNILNWSSQVLKLNQVKSSVQAVTGLRVADVSDYGDGRDMEINFTQPSTTSNITYYRAYVVKAKDASTFNLNAANKVSSANSTIIYKGNSSTVKAQLTSSSRDTSGELIKSGTAYVVYIMSVSTNTTMDSKLSTSSSSLTLSVNTAAAPVITQVRDISDYGDGRDIQVSFNRVSDESKVANYRVFVVRNSVTSSFNLNTASNLSSSLYYTVNKTGNNITVTLPSNMRDTSGYNITNLQDYRIYVMAAGSQQNNYTNALSASSSVLRLTSNSNAGVASNLSVADIGDNGNGSDLRVTFNRASDESNISHYRVFVVPASYAGSFNLNSANSSNYYTQVNKTGSNLSVTLQSGTRDTIGNLIVNGLPYRVFVLSVNNNGNWSQNALSSSSAQITLTQNATVLAPTSVAATDVADNGNGSDLGVSFNRSSDETNVNHYRVFVVKNSDVNSFNLSAALKNGYYTTKSKTGSNQTFNLTNDARSTDGNLIANNIDYRVFVVAVNNNSSQSSAISSASAVVRLTNNSAVGAVVIKNVDVKKEDQAAGNITDVTVTYIKPNPDQSIRSYQLMVVPASTSFDLNAAQATVNRGYTVEVTLTSTSLPSSLMDSNGNTIKDGVPYKIVILSESSDTNRKSNIATSGDFTINAKKQAPTPVGSANVQTPTVTADSVSVSFTKPNETGIASYEIYITKTNPANQTLRAVKTVIVNDNQPISVPIGSPAKDSSDVDFAAGDYKIWVVAVPSDSTKTSSKSNEVTFTIPAANPSGTSSPDTNGGGASASGGDNNTGSESTSSGNQIP